MPRISSRTIQPVTISRRRLPLARAGRNARVAALSRPSLAAQSPAFARWVAGFRSRAIERGISEATYDRVMTALTPDASVLAEYHAQPEFTEQVWQYINRRCSDWRVITGKERAKEYAGLLARIEKDYGVDRYIMLGLWGMESSFGDVIVNRKYMRPVIPALAALAWGEPRRRRYWEAELLNALTIVDRGWAKPADMIGSWAGAMGHTQWMPEVWLHMGVDYDHDGRITPFGRPDNSLAGTARFLVERGKYRRGEAWGCEVALAGRAPRRLAHLCAMARARHQPRRRQGLRASRRPRQIMGAGARRAGLSDRAEFLRRACLQPVDQLHAGAVPSRRPDPRRPALRPAVPRRRAGADARGGEGNPAPPQRAAASRPTASTGAPARTRSRPSSLTSAKSAWSRPTAMPASRCWPGCARARDPVQMPPNPAWAGMPGSNTCRISSATAPKSHPRAMPPSRRSIARFRPGSTPPASAATWSPTRCARSTSPISRSIPAPAIAACTTAW